MVVLSEIQGPKSRPDLPSPLVRSGCASRPTTRPVRALAATPPSGPGTVASSSLDFQPGACERSSAERAQYHWKARERAKSGFVMRSRTLCLVTSRNGGSRACSPSEHEASHFNCVRKQASLRRSDKLGSSPRAMAGTARKSRQGGPQTPYDVQRRHRGEPLWPALVSHAVTEVELCIRRIAQRAVGMHPAGRLGAVGATCTPCSTTPYA